MTFRKARISRPGNSPGKFMPSISSTVPLIPTMPNQVPIFLIPGILGNAAEYQDLIETLRELGDNRDIYIWCNPQITGTSDIDNDDQSSLQKQAKLIAASMSEIPLDPSTVRLLAGYSYGCGLAALVVEELKKINRETDVELFLIDGPSPDCAKKYFSSSSLSLTTDLAAVVKYAATLSVENVDFQEDDITFNEELLSSLVLLSPADCIDTLAKLVIENCSVIDENQFIKNIKIAKQDIYNIINAPDHLFDSKFHKIISLITNQTAAKYNDKFGGWKQHAEKLSVIDDPLLIDQDHRALLKQDREYNNLLVLENEPMDGFIFDDQTIAILKKAKEISVYRTVNNILEVQVLQKGDVDSKILELLEKNSLEKDVDTVIIEYLDKHNQDEDKLKDLLFYFTLKCGYSNVSKLARAIEKFVTQEVKLRTPLMLEKHFKALEEHVNLLLETFCPIDKYSKSNSIMQLYETASRLQNCNNASCTEKHSSEISSSNTVTEDNNDTKVNAPTNSEASKGKRKILDLTRSGSSTKIESFSNSDNDSSADEENENELYNSGRVNPETYFETVNQLKMISQRFKLFTPHACGKENSPPNQSQFNENEIKCGNGSSPR